MSAKEKQLQQEYKALKKIVEAALVDTVINVGGSKHNPWHFLQKTKEFHLQKCIRHIMTHEIGDGKKDHHLHNAITRLAMALMVEKLEEQQEKENT